MIDALSRVLFATGLSLAFITPPLILTLLVALILTAIQNALNKSDPPKAPVSGGDAPDNPTYGDLVRLAAGFGGFGFVLGFMLAISGSLLFLSIAGTVTSAGITYLSLLFGKDAIQNSPRTLTAALLTFFVSLMLTLEYTRAYLGLGGR
jgi:hypothetical protein